MANQTPTTNTVQEAAHAGADAAAQAAHKLIDRVAHSAEGQEKKLRASTRQAQKKLQKSWQTARAKSVDAKDSVGGFVRRHPLISVGLAIGVGALLVGRSQRRTLPITGETNAETDEQDSLPVH